MTCVLVLLALLCGTKAGEARGASTTASSSSTTTTTAAAPQVRAVTWQKLAANVEAGEMEVAGEPKPLKVTRVSFDAFGGTVRVLELADPKITQSSWEISGKVKYANVQENGYIEMWSHFPDGSAYFTRTLDTSGPLGVLHGTSEWREFRLPFFSEAGKAPSKLVVNVVLPGGGTVWLGPATLKEAIARPAPAAGAVKRAGGGMFAAPWWGTRGGGVVGATVGLMCGVYGGVMGILASWARGRRLSIPVMVGGLVVCGLMVLTALVAWASGQPYGVWYPLLLSGMITGMLTGTLIPVLKRRLEEDELRQMTALDA
jgi:hypothetical protein